VFMESYNSVFAGRSATLSVHAHRAAEHDSPDVRFDCRLPNIKCAREIEIVEVSGRMAAQVYAMDRRGVDDHLHTPCRDQDVLRVPHVPLDELVRSLQLPHVLQHRLVPGIGQHRRECLPQCATRTCH